jgi:hypothetical protein
MHDVGKIGIPDRILLKPARLDPQERRVMETHVSIGKQILDGHQSNIMRTASRICESHHEHWDGSGYPNGLAGDAIPIEGRIAAICDVFDALTSARPYKDPWPNDRAIAYIRDQAGRHFDPTLAEHFVSIAPEVIALRRRHPDAGRQSDERATSIGQPDADPLPAPNPVKVDSTPDGFGAGLSVAARVLTEGPEPGMEEVAPAGSAPVRPARV